MSSHKIFVMNQNVSQEKNAEVMNELAVYLNEGAVLLSDLTSDGKFIYIAIKK